MTMIQSQKQPLATITMASGAKIILEIHPESAPNAAASFMWLAGQGAYNNRAIKRIVPDFVIQPTYTSFDKDPVCDFLIDNESRINGHDNPNAMALTKYAVAMGGDGETLASGSCFFIVVGDVPRLDGKYPGFARVISGFEELDRLVQLEMISIEADVPGVVINEPKEPQVIESITVETFGVSYGEPVKTEGVLAYDRK